MAPHPPPSIIMICYIGYLEYLKYPTNFAYSAYLPILAGDTLIRGRTRRRKRRLKSEFVFFQYSSRLLQLIYFVKCRRTLFQKEFITTIFKEKRIISSQLVKSELGIFTSKSSSDGKEMYKKRDARAVVVPCPQVFGYF